MRMPLYRFFLENKDTNLFDASAITIGYKIDTTTGAIVQDDYSEISAQIDVTEGTYLLTENIPADDGVAFCMYGASNNYLGYKDASSNAIKIPVGVTKVIISFDQTTFTASAVEVYASRLVHPVYKDDITLDIGKESNQEFYRRTLNGKLDFVEEEFDLINNEAFSHVFWLLLQISYDGRQTWSDYLVAKFFKTDGTFNIDDRKVTIQPTTIDDYTAVLAGAEKEYNIIPLAPPTESLIITKRPLIQVYMLGDSVVSNFVGGTYWEQDVTESTTDKTKLKDYYHFAVCSRSVEIRVTGGSPDVSGLYLGRLTYAEEKDDDDVWHHIWRGNLYTEGNNDYYIRVIEDRSEGFYYSYQWIRKTADDPGLDEDNDMFYHETGEELENSDFTFNPMPGQSVATGNPSGELAVYDIYARFLLDVDAIGSQQTYNIPSDDIVDYNRNYKKIIGYEGNVIYLSRRTSATPTEWGRTDNGTYYAPPLTFGDNVFYPVARTSWRYASVWFCYQLSYAPIERSARKPYTMKDAYPIAGVIKVLLSQFAPNIQHEGIAEYSQFLYSGNNPVSGDDFYLYLTPKSNILAGEYQTPAQKAPTTFAQIMSVLKNVYQCYWYIENGKLKIEHISFFLNGGSYSGSPVMGTDLTNIVNTRNGKAWSFCTSEYSFDKPEMPDRYQFKWMDDVTEPFQGLPIKINSPYVTEGKNEEINASYVTSDIDMMLLNPTSFSQDGFAIMSATKFNALEYDDSNLYPLEGTTEGSGQGELTIPHIPVYEQAIGHNATLFFVILQHSAGTEIAVTVLDAEDRPVHTFSAAPAQDGVEMRFHFQVPPDTAKICFTVWGSIRASVKGLFVDDIRSLPFVSRTFKDAKLELQNGLLAYCDLQPKYWRYNMPAKSININGEDITAEASKKKKQSLSYPQLYDPNPQYDVKTEIGNGQIEKLSINLASRTAKATLRYDTE